MLMEVDIFFSSNATINLMVNNNGCLMVGMIASGELRSSAQIKDCITGIYSSATTFTTNILYSNSLVMRMYP